MHGCTPCGGWSIQLLCIFCRLLFRVSSSLRHSCFYRGLLCCFLSRLSCSLLFRYRSVGFLDGLINSLLSVIDFSLHPIDEVGCSTRDSGDAIFPHHFHRSEPNFLQWLVVANAIFLRCLFVELQVFACLFERGEDFILVLQADVQAENTQDCERELAPYDALVGNFHHRAECRAIVLVALSFVRLLGELPLRHSRFRLPVVYFS
mmetsp:Transcript_10522/g.20205  ORF Transcript_10522/g.20205 Transcript_10522/m.20205 type:complete len:205 (+) Transcript_10522:141-755(+)